MEVPAGSSILFEEFGEITLNLCVLSSYRNLNVGYQSVSPNNRTHQSGYKQLNIRHFLAGIKHFSKIML